MSVQKCPSCRLHPYRLIQKCPSCRLNPYRLIQSCKIFQTCCNKTYIKTINKKNFIQSEMNSLDMLLTNTTNRFLSTSNNLITQSNSSFTLIQSKQHSIDRHLLQFVSQSEFITIQETYTELQLVQKKISKSLKQSYEEKKFMTQLFEKIFMMEQDKQQPIKKRFRRKKTEIEAKYSCETCNKIYTSSTSLARHTKLKHSYSISEPPQHNYQIPPQPNSISNSDHLQSEARENEEKKLLGQNDRDEFEILSQVFYKAQERQRLRIGWDAFVKIGKLSNEVE